MIGVIIAGFKAASLAIKGLSLLKYVSPAVAVFSLAKNYVLKYWKITIIAILAAALLAGTWLHNREARRLNARIDQYEVAVRDYDRVNAINTRALYLCYAINNENTERFIRAQAEGKIAVRRLERQLIEQNAQVEKIDEEITELRGRDEDCRSLDDPLPDWFDDWLRE